MTVYGRPRCLWTVTIGRHHCQDTRTCPSDIVSTFTCAEAHGHVRDFVSRQHHPTVRNWRIRIAEEFESEFLVLQQEKRSDLLLSTLRRTVKTMGGSLSFVA